MKNFLAAGFLAVLILAACSGKTTAGEEAPQPQKSFITEVVNVIPSATAAPQENTASAITPIAAPTQREPCSEPSGKTVPYEISWKDEILAGRIYTPPCYGVDTDRKYPTLYLLHGAVDTDQQWDDLGLDEWADILISGGEIPPLIIIMPREITWIVLPENPFGDHLVKAVIPWVDNHYQTLDDREYRAVGGMSRGGNWAVRLGLLHWGLFGSIGAHSTPLFIGDLKRVPGWVEIIPASQTPRLLMDIGQDDNNLAEAQALHKSLLNLDFPHEWRLYPGLHDEQYWKTHLEEYLKWYSAGWAGQ